MVLLTGVFDRNDQIGDLVKINVKFPQACKIFCGRHRCDGSGHWLGIWSF